MKIDLKVNAQFDLDGSIRPTSIVWEDGRVFEDTGCPNGAGYGCRGTGHAVHMPDTGKDSKTV